jgi:hypothetical protein
MAISTVPTIAYYIHRTSLCFAKVVQVAIVRLAESARTILAPYGAVHACRSGRRMANVREYTSNTFACTFLLGATWDYSREYRT